MYLLTIIAFSFLAVYISQEAEVIFREKDSSRIVIDEWAGFLWAMLFISPTAPNIIGAAVLFRVFDIVKPYPARLFQDKLPGGYGVVTDDVAAGIYANLCVHLLIRGGIL